MNDSLVARYFDMWNTGDGSAAHEILGPDWVDHAHPESTGPAGVQQAVRRLRSTDPDLRFRIDAILGNGELTAAVGGVTRGPGADAAPTRIIWLVRTRDGRMREMWTYHARSGPDRPATGAAAA